MEGPATNTWYVLELAVDDAAGLRASMWAEGSAGYRYERRYEMPRGLAWRFHTWGYQGSTLLDNYVEERPTLTGSDTRIVGKHYEYDSVSGQATKRYYAAGRLLATRTGSTLRFIQPDHLGSSATITDPNGNVVARERYGAFGERRRGESIGDR